MMARRGVMGVFAGAAAAVLGGCGFIAPPQESLRYRLTVEVETPQGLRSGSSVIETTWIDGPGIGDASGLITRLHGEAVAVDLPGGQTLFALLRSVGDGDGAGYHGRLFNQALADGAVPEPPLTRRFAAHEWIEERREARRLRPRLMLPPEHYPMLVRFRDIADPTSVEEVDPANLAASFGRGVRLRRIVLAVTDDPVTTGIEKRLAWLLERRTMDNPGWAKLPLASRLAINGLYSGNIGKRK